VPSGSKKLPGVLKPVGALEAINLICPRTQSLVFHQVTPA